MGMSSAKNNRGKSLVSDINVTPMVDVMLVLLIIFMVTAPMMTQGLNVELPETDAKALPQDEDIKVVTIEKDGKISIGDLETPQDLIFKRLNGENKEENRNKPIFLKADKDVSYGLVAAVMAEIKSAGYEKLGMITRPADKQRK
ncbi:MAG: protein TolR [Deltaproteobacteria bacterium]|nr:MAG: protein TolR [Deltaproteobacteria bacterium]